MFLERKDVNPDRADTKYGRTLLTWATRNGREGVVKMLLERKNVRPAVLDDVNQALQSMALPKGHDGPARIPQLWAGFSMVGRGLARTS